jgi:hypothetical protein
MKLIWHVLYYILEYSRVVYVFNLHGMGRPSCGEWGISMYASVESIPRKSIFRLPGRIYGNGRYTDSEIAKRFYE